MVEPARARRPIRSGRRREGVWSARKPQIAEDGISEGSDGSRKIGRHTGSSEESGPINGQKDGYPMLDFDNRVNIKI